MILSFTTAASWKPDLCLDSTGNPNIVFNYETGTSPVIGNVGFIKWNGSAWVDADGSGQESMSVFSNQYPAPAMLISLALDSHDRPHVSFNWGVMPLDVYYFQWNGSAWVDANGTVQYPMFVYQYPGYPSFDDSDQPRIVLDGMGNPVISWCQKMTSSGGFYLLRWNGTAWVDADGTGQESIDITGSPAALGSNVLIDSTGIMQAVWANSASGGDIFYEKWACGSLPIVSPTITMSATGTPPTQTPSLTVSPTITRTPSYTFTNTPASSPTVTLTFTPSDTGTPTPIPAGTPYFTVSLDYGPAGDGFITIDITSSQLLTGPLGVTVYVNGDGGAAPVFYYTAVQSQDNPLVYTVQYPKQPGLGDITAIIVTGTDAEGTAVSNGTFHQGALRP